MFQDVACLKENVVISRFLLPPVLAQTDEHAIVIVDNCLVGAMSCS